MAYIYNRQNQEELGFKMVRFTNKDITDNLGGVLEAIANKLKNNLTLPLL